MNLYNGEYLTGSMPYEDIQTVLDIRNNTSKVDSLKNSILNLTKYQVSDIVDGGDKYIKENRTIKGYDFDKTDFKYGELLDYQTVGTAFMFYSKKAMLSDEVGTGKTVQASGLINFLRLMNKTQGKDFRYLFITKNSIASEIRDKLVQFSGEYVYLAKDGSTKTVEKYIEHTKGVSNLGVVATHTIFNSSEFLLDTSKNIFDIIIVDESREFRNTKKEIYKKAKKILHMHERVILMNATPIELELRDVYNQLALLEKGYMPLVSEFEYNHVIKKPSPRGFGWEITGYKNQEKFSKCIELRQIGRTREELGAVYENNKFIVVEVEKSDVQKKLEKLTTLYQMLFDYPKGIDKTIPFDFETTPKLEAVDKVLTEEFEYGKTQALIYCKYREAQYDLERFLNSQGYRTKVLNGSTDLEERRAISKEYEEGKYDVLITNVLEGLDLGTCSLAIIYTVDPNPQNLVQFEGRMTRDFNVKDKKLIMVVTEGREMRTVRKTLNDRVSIAEGFMKVGNSLTLSAIKETRNTLI